MVVTGYSQMTMLGEVASILGVIVCSVSLSQFLALAFMSGLFVYLVVTSGKQMNLPPGPPGLPIIGNALELKESSLMSKSFEWRDKYGPVIWYTTGTSKWVCLMTIEAVTEALIERGADYANRPTFTSADYFNDGGKDIGNSQFTERLRVMRKIAMQAVRQYMKGEQLTSRIHSVVSDGVEQMAANKGPFNPHPYLTNIIFNIINSMCFGYTLKSDDPEYRKILHSMDVTISNIFGFWEDLIPVLQYWPTKRYRQFTKDVDVFLAHMRQQVAKRRAKFDPKKVETLVDSILLAKEEINMTESGPKLTDTDAGYIVVDVYAGGVDTTRAVLDWLVLMLAIHQDAQKKCHDEIDAVLGDDVPGRDRRLSYTYNEAVVLEVLRLYPAVFMNMARKTACDTKLAGYDIPKNTGVVSNLMAIHRDPRHWEKPDSFMPERFIEDDGKTLKARPKSWMPFSMGLRGCLGGVLAKADLMYTSICLLQKLHIDLAPDYTTPDIRHQDRFWSTCICYPYEITVTRRNLNKSTVSANS